MIGDVSFAATFSWSVIFGLVLGFGFGVGCALAVMYSIYLGGYRAAVRDAALDEPPRKLREMRETLARGTR